MWLSGPSSLPPLNLPLLDTQRCLPNLCIADSCHALHWLFSQLTFSGK